MNVFSSLVLACCACVVASAQSGGWKFPCPQNEIARYTALRAAKVKGLDGIVALLDPQAAATVSPSGTH